MSAPTLINLPPPPSDPVTPSDMPGTPTSTTTSMSELSTVAIKDGHRGHPHHHSHQFREEGLQPNNNTSLDAQRADRISRMTGLERVTTARQSSTMSIPMGGSANNPQGYFEQTSAPSHTKERSTVGSASATGSAGGRTTWASGSDAYDTTDKMSEDQDMMDGSSIGGVSDEGNASLVGFGEGAGSTVSGPTSSAPNVRNLARANGAPGRTQTTTTAGATTRDGKATDATGGTETAERIMSNTSFDNDVGMGGTGVHSDGKKELGRFGFEETK